MLASKAKVLDYLKSKEETGLTWTVIAIGTFFDLYLSILWKSLPYAVLIPFYSCLSVGFYGHDVTKREATIWDTGDVKFSATTTSMIAKAVLCSLAKAYRDSERISLYISSFEITMNELIASFQKAIGVKAWNIEHVKEEEQIKLGRQMIAEGMMWPCMAKLAMGL